MSYSRWSNSRWYTFWSASSPDNIKDDQIFEICEFENSKMFTYKQLKNDIEACLDEAMTIDDNITETEREELKLYMKQFIDDVEKEF